MTFFLILVILISSIILSFLFWPYPIRTESDLEYWSLFNTLYLTRKIINPIRKAQRNSQLEDFFKKQDLVFRKKIDGEIKSKIVISAIGDLLPNSYIHSAKNLYSDVSEFIFGADFKVANFEMNYDPSLPFSGKFGDVRFNANEETYDILMRDSIGRNYNLVFTANNMCFRYGIEGIRNTLDNLDRKGVLHVGTARTKQEAEEFPIVDIQGIKVAFICFTYGTNGVKVDSDKEYLVNKIRLNALDDSDLNLSPVFDQIKKAKEKKADVIVASLHWGREYEFFPYKRQVEIVHELFDGGIDVILSHHAHVVQPFEKYINKEGKECFCAYSLGSITDYYTFHKNNFMAGVRLEFNKVTDKSGNTATYISGCEILPMWIRINKDDVNNTVRLVPIPVSDCKTEYTSSQVLNAKDQKYIKKVRKDIRLISLIK